MLNKHKNMTWFGERAEFIFNSEWKQYLLALFMVAVTAIVCMPFINDQGYHIVSFILFLVVSVQATFLGVGPVFLAAAISSLVWNFFFIPPSLTFHIDKAEDILMFGMFFIIAALNGILTTRVRRQEKLAHEKEQRTHNLFVLTKELSGAGNVDEILGIAIREIQQNFKTESIFILQDGNNSLNTTGRLRKEIQLTRQEHQVAEWSFHQGKMAGSFTGNFPECTYSFFPLPGNRISPGVVALKLNQAFRDEQKKLWETYLVLISNALEREFLAEMAQKARFLAESDRLYKTLFNSISHEFRIPVATIMGASDTLINGEHSEKITQALYSEIFSASLRLNRLIENLLNMARLESGRLSVRLDWYDIHDLINKVAGDLKDEMKSHNLVIDMIDDLPLVRFDFGLMEQALYNLLINAVQYAPPTSEIVLGTTYENGAVVIQIKDRGPGFPEEHLPNVFQKFFRLKGQNTGGLGLGLSIVKGFVEAHKGTITVRNRRNGGACFTVAIPSENADISNLTLEKE